MSPTDANDLFLPEGVCFGWFSSVNANCQPGSCMQSARCQQYTVTMHQTNGMLDVPRKTNTSCHAPAEKKPVENANEADECVRRTYLDNIVACVAAELPHDEVHFDQMHMWASIKKNRNVIAFIIRNKKIVRIRLGSSKETSRGEIELPIGDDIDAVKKQAVNFIKKHA